jgi:hypothetical protein
VTVKTNQPTLRRQMSSQFEGKRQIPFTATAEETVTGVTSIGDCGPRKRRITSRESWPGSAWIVELITTTIKRKGKRSVRRHL